MNNRRPLKVRSHPLSINFAQYLAKKSITPNQISLMSIVFAMIAMVGALLWNICDSITVKIFLLILIIIGVQGRLLCNLFDGMVALEGGKKTPAGELYNDIPDRISDTLIFLGIGLGIDQLPFAFALGLSAALFAALTAYIRTLGSSMGAPAIFAGPMAKQHRMATITITTVFTILLLFFKPQLAPYLFYGMLILITIGAFITCIQRTLKIKNYMEANPHES